MPCRRGGRELARSAPGDARADVYSLGITLHEMLSGRVPFEGPSALEVVTQHLRDQPRPPSSFDPSIGRDLDAIVLRALEEDPDRRFQSAAEMREALSRTAPPPPAPRLAPPTTFVIPLPSRSRRRFLVLTIAAVAVLGSAAVALWAGTRPPQRSRQPIVAAPLAPEPRPSGKQHVQKPPVLPDPVPTPPPIAIFSDRTADPSPVSLELPAEPRTVAKRSPTKATRSEGPSPSARVAPAAQELSSLERGRAALRSRDPAGAVRHFLEASRQQPGSAAPFRGLGDAYSAVGNRVAAIGAYRRYLPLNPTARDADAVRAKLRGLGAN